MTSRLWLRPTAALFGVYAVLLAVATFWLAPVWHEWDWSVFQYLSNLHAPAFSPNVAVVDLADYDERFPTRDRATIAKLLDGMRAHDQRPAAVLLDLYFESVCSSGDAKNCRPDAGTAALTRSLDAAAAAKIPVYATANPIATQGGRQIDAAFLSALDRENVYDHLAAGHTILQLAAADGLFYQHCYRIAQRDSAGTVTGTQDLWALPYRIAKDVAKEAVPPCDDAQEQTMEAVRLGPQPKFAANVHRVTLDHATPAGVDLSGKYVIVATLEKDLGPLHTGTAPRSNPELLAWAMSDLLERKNTDARYFQPFLANDLLAALIAGFTLVTLIGFIAAFQGLRRLRLQSLRSALPWIAAAGAAGFALALFGAFESWMFFTRQIQPQVSLVAIAVLLCAAVCGERGREMLFEQSRAIDAAPEESNDYDVFVSYAHDEFAWVFENVYKPLEAARTSDGRKLQIFFDTSSLRVGAAWQDKISLAIDGSRVVVPVYSETYFKRPYCRFEIKRAHRKWIAQGESSRCVLPVMRGRPIILQTVDDIQATSIDDDPGLMAEIVAMVIAGAETPAPPAPVPGPAS